MLFPRRRVEGLGTINQTRGKSALISDRLDLTVECIRLHYSGISDVARNPLGPTLARSSNYFDLFEAFSGFVDFWLLHDPVIDGGKHVDLFLPSDGFSLPSRPETVDNDLTYRERACAFVRARNQRMFDWVTQSN